ncbi:uncharacterized protein LOC144006368 isoform X2 [Festucalex cinctus]
MLLRSRSGLPIASAGPVLPAICIICKNKFQIILVWDRKEHGRGIISPKQKHCQQVCPSLQLAPSSKPSASFVKINFKLYSSGIGRNTEEGSSRQSRNIVSRQDILKRRFRRDFPQLVFHTPFQQQL